MISHNLAASIDDAPMAEDDAIKTENRNFEDRLLRDLFARLNADQIHYVVLRNFDRLPRHIGNDLDILVAPGDLAKFRLVVSDVFVSHGLFPSTTAVEANGVALKGTPIQNDETAEDAVAVRIHAQFWISFETSMLHRRTRGLSDKVFLADMQRDVRVQDGCEFFIPSELDQFVILFKQWSYKQKPEYREKLISLSSEPAVQEVFRSELSEPLTEDYILFREPASPKVTEILGRLVRARWGNFGLGRTLGGYASAAKLYLSQVALRPAPILYLAGPDGCGKTTTAKMVRELLKRSGVRHRHFYSMKKNLLRDLTFFIRGLISGDDPRKVGRTRVVERRRFILSEDVEDRDDGTKTWRFRKLTTLLISLNDIFICYLPVLFMRLRGDLIVIETSPYDLFIKYHMPRFERIEKFFSPLLPAPSLGLLLVADPDRIVARKPELNAVEIADYYERMTGILQTGDIEDRFVKIKSDDGLDYVKKQLPRALANFT